MEGLLVVLVVTVLAVTGLVVYQRYKSTSAKASAATNSTQPQAATTTQPAQAATQYLDIKEWGVKLPLSDSIKDVYYVIPIGKSKNADGQPSAVDLGLASLNSSCGTVTPNSTSFSHTLGSIVRTPPTEIDPVSAKLYTQLEPNGTTIGSYYYGYANAQLKNKTCAPAATRQSIDSAFGPAAKGIIAATDPNYLVIKEWGIKIKLADADKITYTLGGKPNDSAANADAIVSWATLRLNSSVTTSDKCKILGYEAEQLTAATNATKIGKYDYGFSGGAPDPCGDSTVDALRTKITGTELVNSAITSE